MMKCENCYHCELCEWHKLHYHCGSYNATNKCANFIDKSQIIELPMMTTDKLKEELTKYCYERCVDEL